MMLLLKKKKRRRGERRREGERKMERKCLLYARLCIRKFIYITEHHHFHNDFMT